MKKKYTYTTDRELEGLRWTAKIVDFGVALTVTAALNELTTAYVILRERHDLFRQNMKRLANEAMRKAAVRRGRMFTVMRSRQFFDTYSDRVIDLAEQDITLFRISIKQTLDTARHPDAELIAYAETARALLELAATHFQSVMERARREYGTDYSEAFCEFSAADVHRAWERVCQPLYITCLGDIDLNTPSSVGLFKQIARKFGDGDYVQPCLQEAAREHPDFTNEIVIKD